jgi:hypothetical protein
MQLESVPEYRQQEACSMQGEGWWTRTEVTNFRPRVRRQHAPDDDIEFYLLRVTIFSQSVWMQLGTDVSTSKGWILSKAKKNITTTHATRSCIRAWRRAAGCMMVPIPGVHSCYSTTISEGGVWGRRKPVTCCRWVTIATETSSAASHETIKVGMLIRHRCI